MLPPRLFLPIDTSNKFSSRSAGLGLREHHHDVMAGDAAVEISFEEQGQEEVIPEVLKPYL